MWYNRIKTLPIVSSSTQKSPSLGVRVPLLFLGASSQLRCFNVYSCVWSLGISSVLFLSSKTIYSLFSFLTIPQGVILTVFFSNCSICRLVILT